MADRFNDWYSQEDYGDPIHLRRVWDTARADLLRQVKTAVEAERLDNPKGWNTRSYWNAALDKALAALDKLGAPTEGE